MFYLRIAASKLHSLLIFWVCLCHDPICIIPLLNWRKKTLANPTPQCLVCCHGYNISLWLMSCWVSLYCTRVSYWEFNLYWSSAVLSSLHIWCFRRGSLCGAGGAVLFMDLWDSWSRGNVGSAYCQCDRTKFSISYDKNDMCVYRGPVLTLLSPLIE